MMSNFMRNLWPLLILLIIPLSTWAAPASQPAFVPPWGEDVYPISLWCGPPTKFVTVERFKQMAAAGFTVAMPSCDGASPETNRKILDSAEAAGIKSFVMDGRIPYAISGSAAVKKGLDDVLADYGKHPALAGYFVCDEPGPGAFPGLAEVTDYLHQKDPAHPAYINLLPNFVTPDAIGGSYEKYIEGFCETLHPFAVCYDHYHMMKSGDRPGFFENLATVRAVSLRHHVPFWNIVLSTAHNVYRPLSEAEKRYEAMQTLAYGGGGLMWFTYWQPTVAGNWGDAIINADGTPTKQYDEITRINHDVQVIGHHLVKATSIGVFQGKADSPVGLPVRCDDKRVTIGVFRAGKVTYVFAASRDYHETITSKLMLKTAGGEVAALDTASGLWQPQSVSGGGLTEVKLDAGGGRLLRW
jgi:hypothetical protein